ncbi:nucleoside recognition domain-containing protein [Chengkuizengella axinellae]|uniref:Nucleoside recognition domain-containing protein n=1 Tax=Chengkuizengella axinellae TaxID=3064388 RepID=A0ABT9IWN1_9BACL|nr:nucleoside recognition domain-containing protein [Chengkuizengella sp. 2205SS18-9]MDP5273757.1 nucleoside recognition domain-containing protein [Chengkuizengella sp. 2205SS18-9]
MVNYIWLFFIVAGFIAAALQGNIELFSEAVFEGAKTGVTICFSLISFMVLWLGLLRIAEDAGLLKKLAILLRPVVRFLFPTIPKDHPAIGYIMSNMSANMLGLNNAATPMGIKAMEELQKINPKKDTASTAMCTLLALNTSSITIIPITIIGIRMANQSMDPFEIVGTTLMATAISTTAAILVDKWYQRKSLRNE